MMTEIILHVLNEILQISKFKFFVSQKKVSRIAQIFLKFANVKHNSKIQKYFLSLKLFWGRLLLTNLFTTL